MAKPRIVQCLCPQRHCIMALPYEPGITTAAGGQLIVTEEIAPDMMRTSVDMAIAAGQINPWCGLCRAPREDWLFEDAPLRFDTLEKAIPHLREEERRQALFRESLEKSKN